MKTKKGWERGEPATVGERKGGNGAQSLVIENGTPEAQFETGWRMVCASKSR